MVKTDFDDTKKQMIGRWRNLPKLGRWVIRWIGILLAAIVFDYFLVVLLASLTSINVIDWRTVVSLVMVEVFAVVVAKLVGIGEPSDLERTYQTIRIAASKAQSIPQFYHLRAISIENEGHSRSFPYSRYRIVNTRTKVCYWVPSYIDELIKEEVVQETKLKDKLRMDEYMKTNNLKDESRYPKNDELSIWSTE